MTCKSRRTLAIFGITSVAAFWVHAAGHVWLLWRGNQLVREHRATLAFRSALVGDSLLLPIINVLLDRQLSEWNDGPSCPRARRKRLARSLLAGVGCTALIHTIQGTMKLTNWTMPRPWRWNAMGYYHALYMAGQFTILAYFGGAASARARDRGSCALLTRELLAAGSLIIVFAALVYKDYY